MPDDQTNRAPEAKAQTVRAKHAASLIVLRMRGGEANMLMGMRGRRHVFMPNRLVFPGGRVDSADLRTPVATELADHADRHLRRRANPALARALGVTAARELREETGLSMGDPAALDGLWYLARAITPPNSPIRYNARFLVIEEERVSGTIGGDGELDGLRYYPMSEAMALDLALPTRRVLEQLQIFLGMSVAQRMAREALPVLKKDMGWRYE